MLSIGKSAHGRALFASRVIRTGDCILRVPYNVQLASDNLPPEINTLIGDDIGNVAKLAIVVLLEKKLGWWDGVLIGRLISATFLIPGRCIIQYFGARMSWV